MRLLGMARVSVLMPTHEQSTFIARAVGSLVAQTVDDWELHIVDDGSLEDVRQPLTGFLDDPRIHLHRRATNGGLGAACNLALDRATAPIVAYLPSDDLWDERHLATGLAALSRSNATLVHSGMRHHGSDASIAPLPSHGLQLVQVMHRRSGARWLERRDLETDDLERLFFRRFPATTRQATGAVTCTWVDHPAQRHKAIRERFDGGLNVFRSRYRITEPLRFATRDGTDVDERRLYHRFQRPVRRQRDGEGLRILLVGDLGFNPERVTALEERGHELLGLWTQDTLGPHSVGPLPVGQVRDLDPGSWRQQVEEQQPDVVYAQQNWRSVGLAREVIDADLGVPVVWHFKEAPQRCIARGDWPVLADVVTRADACLFASDEEAEWFELALPGRCPPVTVVDGDLPSAAWGTGPASTTLRWTAGGAHIGCVGRPVGVDPGFMAGLAAHDVHLHLHGLVDAPGPGGAWTGWLAEAQRRAPDHLHVHPPVPPSSWRAVLSRYDAGLLHRVSSHNHGDLRVATWDDLNLPARIHTYAAASLPLLVPDQPGHRVATQELVRRTGGGLLYDGPEHLAAQLHHFETVEQARKAMDDVRHTFTFDHHADTVVDVLRGVAR